MGTLFIAFMVWIPGSLLVANVAGWKGHPRGEWFAASLMVTPFLALLALCALPNQPGPHALQPKSEA